MKKAFAILLLCSATAFASGTITPATRVNACPSTSASGKISAVDVQRGHITVVTPQNQTKILKVTKDTLFRIPGASKQDLQASPLSKVPANSETKVFYCAKDSSVLELKLEK